jgi:hypothetical protein
MQPMRDAIAATSPMGPIAATGPVRAIATTASVRPIATTGAIATTGPVRAIATGSMSAIAATTAGLTATRAVDTGSGCAVTIATQLMRRILLQHVLLRPIRRRRTHVQRDGTRLRCAGRHARAQEWRKLPPSPIVRRSP